MNYVQLNSLVQILGWALLHSLWQAAIVYLIFMAARRFIPSASPSLKYGLGLAALSAILLSSIVTLITLFLEIAWISPGPASVFNFNGVAAHPVWKISEPEFWVAARLWINNHLSDIVRLWMAGTIFFACRLMLAGWYASRLQKHIIPIDGLWNTRLQALAASMRIKRTVVLGQSGRLTSPLLVGYVKPLILLPVGMLSGLSTEQVEAILLHELAHVRRHDYIVNLMQSVMEVTFYFNPFVWAISARIRVDREQCCDDAVVSLVNPLTYAQALYQLEETQADVRTLALAAVGKKNQLLNRIKRIMEPLKNKKEAGGKMISAITVVVLIFVSGLFVRAYLPDRVQTRVADPASGKVGVSDTTIKDMKKEKSATYSRRSITTHENGQPQEEIVESYDGDESLRPVLAIPPVGIPELALAPLEELSEIAALEAIEPVDVLVPDLKFNLEFTDSLPEPQVFVGDNPSWGDFEKKITAEFRSRFPDFYGKNQPEFEKMMKDMEGSLERLQIQRARTDEEMSRVQRDLDRLAPRQRELMSNQQEAMARIQSQLANHQNQIMWSQKDSMEKAQRALTRVNEKLASMNAFEKVLAAELIKDGYLGKGEKIRSMSWNDDGSIKVNDKEIKAADRDKYHQLHKGYFRERSAFGKTE